jgi:hypothetical protein
MRRVRSVIAADRFKQKINYIKKLIDLKDHIFHFVKYDISNIKRGIAKKKEAIVDWERRNPSATESQQRRISWVARWDRLTTTKGES